jgi:predicted alpha-1,2-mannosidase
MTGDRPVVRSVPTGEHGRPFYEHHTTDAFWGSWWTLNTLWPLVYPEKIKDFCQTLISMYRDGGILPRENVGGMYDFVMIGAHSTPFVVQAFQRHMGSFDPIEAYEALRKNHFPGGLMGKAGYEYDTAIGGGIEDYIDLGYVRHGIEAHAMHCDGASQTLEYAYEDWCLAQMAKALGNDDDYRLFMKRSENYRNIWDPESGFFRPRHPDGTWLEPFDPMAPEGWCEANAYHYLFWVPHDLQGLIELMGGRNPFTRRLNKLFEQARQTDFLAPHGSHHASYMDYGNQPCTGLAHVFSHAGAPWLTQQWVREVMAGAKSDITPQGGYGGDEDQGQMGALNVLMAIGLFQTRGGCEPDPVYEITSPIFERVTIRLDPAFYGTPDVAEPRLVIEAPGASDRMKYIRSVILNGNHLDRPWFRHSDLIGGALLNIELGATPNKAWGTAPECAPPSGSEA